MSDILLSKLLKNLKMLNVSNNNIVHARHTHFATMEHLEVVDLSNNHLHCDEGFHELIKWLAKRNVNQTDMTRAHEINNISFFDFSDFRLNPDRHTLVSMQSSVRLIMLPMSKRRKF